MHVETLRDGPPSLLTELRRDKWDEKLPFAGYSACPAEALRAKADLLFEIVWDDRRREHARLENRDPRRRTPGRTDSWTDSRIKYAGGHRIRVTPVPIPNTEVKPDTADGTAWETAWESRSLPAVFFTEARCRRMTSGFLCSWTAFPAPRHKRAS